MKGSYVRAGGLRPSKAWSLPPCYRPPAGKDILLLLPCAQTKPYAQSPFHRAVASSLRGLENSVHYCTISEEMGVVPRELEGEIPYYDTYPNEAGVLRASLALATYLRVHGSSYSVKVAYATSKTFRRIVEAAAIAKPTDLVLLPHARRFRKSSAFFEFMRRRGDIRRHLDGKRRRATHAPKKGTRRGR